LACPVLNDALLLHLFSESQPYDLRVEGWQQQDGRSVRGSNRIKGASYTVNPRVLQASFLVSLPQANFFSDLLLAQEAGHQITIEDRMYFAAPTIGVYWLQVDDAYLSTEPSLPLSWRRLQFTAYEDI
jgi:hypothetical protein